MRKRYNFWLNDQVQGDWHINELITKLKDKGQFTRAIREGLRLWADLRAGHTTVLLELFPAVAESLGATVIEKPVPTPDSSGGGQLEEIKTMLEMITAQQSSGGYLMQSALPAPAPQPEPATPAPTTGKLLSGFKPLAAPVIEDEELLEFTASTKGTAAQNFMRMLGSL